MKKLILFLILSVLVFSACEIINPEEEIPSYIRVEEAFIDITNPMQGSAIHNISDCWLYVNGKAVGIFEIPFEVPALASGNVKVEIEPGIRTSGADADRDIYTMLTNYKIDTILTAGKTHTITPHYQYRSGVNFVLVESFDEVGCKFQNSDSSTYMFQLSTNDTEEGNAMYISIPQHDYSGTFECLTNEIYSLSPNGMNFLEISYKSNDYFNFGMFGIINSALSTQGKRENIYLFAPTNGKWKRTYIDLNFAVTNSSATDGEFQPFFTAIRTEDRSPKDQNTEIYIDNIKLLHIETGRK